MKYRIIFSKRGEATSRRGAPRLRGRNTLGRIRASQIGLVEFAELFDFGSFYEPYSEPPPSTFWGRLTYNICVIRQKLRVAAERSRAAAGRISDGCINGVSEISQRIKKKRQGRPRLPSLLPTLAGALCGAVAVALISSGFVVYKLVIKDYFGSYETVTVPNFVGSIYPSGESFEGSDFCNISISYVYSDLPEGTVISQFPAPDVTRRVYSDRNLCNVDLTVSLGERTYTMNDYATYSLRDALLELRNEAIRVEVERVYSDTVEAGKIISTTPPVGNIFSSKETVKLTVSMGRQTVYVSVPNLYKLTESRATLALKQAGLSLGTVTYIQSTLPVGTVISQSHAAYTSVPEGEAVSFTVSAGDRYSERVVPNLYSLTPEEAKAALAEVGLVCGNIYAVPNGDGDGTVIAQSIAPGTPITGGLVSVDIYVSSR